MENKTTDVYVWDPSEEMDTSLVRPDPISLGLFMQYHSIPEAYKIFSKESGVKKALLGEHDNPEFIAACIKTKAWVEGGGPRTNSIWRRQPENTKTRCIVCSRICSTC